MSLFIVGFVAYLASAGTFAFFDDLKTTGQNSMTAGTLTLNGLTDVTRSINGAYPGDADKAIGDSFNVVSNGGVASQLTAQMTNVDIGNTNMYKDLVIYTRGEGGTICTLYDGSKNGPDATPKVMIYSYIAPGSHSHSITLSYTYVKTTAIKEQGGVFKFDIQFELKQL